jgi:hypothetical protein
MSKNDPNYGSFPYLLVEQMHLQDTLRSLYAPADLIEDISINLIKLTEHARYANPEYSKNYSDKYFLPAIENIVMASAYVQGLGYQNIIEKLFLECSLGKITNTIVRGEGYISYNNTVTNNEDEFSDTNYELKELHNDQANYASEILDKSYCTLQALSFAVREQLNISPYKKFYGDYKIRPDILIKSIEDVKDKILYATIIQDDVPLLSQNTTLKFGFNSTHSLEINIPPFKSNSYDDNYYHQLEDIKDQLESAIETLGNQQVEEISIS